MHSLRVTAISSRTRAISASRSLRISAIVAKLRLIDSIPDASTSGRSLDDDDDDDPRSEEKKKKDMQKHCFSAGRGQGVSAREAGKWEEGRPRLHLVGSDGAAKLADFFIGDCADSPGCRQAAWWAGTGLGGMGARQHDSLTTRTDGLTPRRCPACAPSTPMPEPIRRPRRPPLPLGSCAQRQIRIVQIRSRKDTR